MPNHAPIPLGTPVYVAMSLIECDGYIAKIYERSELKGQFVWHYYDVVTFKSGWKHRHVFGKYLTDLLTGLREDGSKMIISG
jgi:hypothetical protein